MTKIPKDIEVKEDFFAGFFYEEFTDPVYRYFGFALLRTFPGAELFPDQQDCLSGIGRTSERE